MVSEGSWWPRGVSSENLQWWGWSSGKRQKSCLFTYRLILLSSCHWRLFRIFFWTHHQPQHEAAHSLSDLRRYVVAKLLQCGQKALQLAELPGTASWRELLVGKGGSWGHGRPITEAVRSGWSTIKRCRRVTAPIQHCQETEWRDDMNPLFCWSVRGMWQIWGCDDARSSLTPYIVQITTQIKHVFQSNLTALPQYNMRLMTPTCNFLSFLLYACACACTCASAVFQLLLSDPPSNLPPYHIYSTLLLAVSPLSWTQL